MPHGLVLGHVHALDPAVDRVVVVLPLHIVLPDLQTRQRAVGVVEIAPIAVPKDIVACGLGLGEAVVAVPFDYAQGRLRCSGAQSSRACLFGNWRG